MELNKFEDTIEIEIVSDKLIKNKELENYIKFLKSKTTLEESDLVDITEIRLDSKDFSGKINLVYFEEIKLFPNLKKIDLYNLGISSKEIKLMTENSKIEKMNFYNCEISNIKELKDLKSLYIENCEIDNKEEIVYLQNLEEITLDYMKFEDYNFLKKLNKLKKLYFINMNKSDLELLPELDKIEYLSLSGMDDIFTYENIDKFINLKTLEISKKIDEELEIELKKIEQKGIKIIVEDAEDEE